MNLITGPMFAGKTTELLRRARETVGLHGNTSVVVLIPRLDHRSGPALLTHNGDTCVASQVDSPEEFQAHLYPRPDLKHLLVDEVQFFGAWVVRELALLSQRRLLVDVGGLLHDYRGAPFENVSQLIPLAERIDFLAATCAECGGRAAWTHRRDPGGGRVAVGGAEMYEARCRPHWEDVVDDPWCPWKD